MPSPTKGAIEVATAGSRLQRRDNFTEQHRLVTGCRAIDRLKQEDRPSPGIGALDPRRSMHCDRGQMGGMLPPSQPSSRRSQLEFLIRDS